MVKNVIVISDIHCGCKLGLCPPVVVLDEYGTYHHSPYQAKVWAMWKEFWDDWVPMVTKGEEYVIVVNGDSIDGFHHGVSTVITNNITDQIRIAQEVLEPVINKEKCVGYYHVRGTEVHVGTSGKDEEILASSLGAIPDNKNNSARWNLNLRMGDEKKYLINFAHHIGTTGSAAYESTAVLKELVEAYNEAGRMSKESPDCVVRSHRHRALEIKIPTTKGYGIVFTTPGWQLKTPLVWRLLSGRTGSPQLGGYLIRIGDEDGLYTRFKIWCDDDSLIEEI